MRLEDVTFSEAQLTVMEHIFLQQAQAACEPQCQHWYLTWAQLLSSRALDAIRPERFLDLEVDEFVALVNRCLEGILDNQKRREVVEKIEAQMQYDFRRRVEPSPADWVVLQRRAEAGDL